MSLLEVSGMSAGYGHADVVRGLELSLDVGGVAVVLGPNGAGKTTTMRALAGTIRSRGTIVLDGKEIGGLRPDQVARSGLRLVPQGRGTLTSLTVRENLLLGASQRADQHAVHAEIDGWLDRFPALGRRADGRAGLMSGGEQQMLALARALIGQPRVLLCDEPSLGLAPVVVTELFKFLREENERSGTAILLVEQNAHLALKVADHVYLLQAGEIVSSGSAADYSDNDMIRQTYLGT